jgi:hypothetical protein
MVAKSSASICYSQDTNPELGFVCIMLNFLFLVFLTTESAFYGSSGKDDFD